MSSRKTSNKDHDVPSGIERVRRLLFSSSPPSEPIEVRDDEGAHGLARYIAELDQLQEDITRRFLVRR